MDEAKQKNFWVNDPEQIENENFSSPVEMTWEEAENVVQETLLQIDKRGWCLWRLRNHKGQKICVIRDYKVQGYPEEYPAFSLAELEMLPEDIKPSTFNLILRAKILGDAVIESVEEIKAGGKNVEKSNHCRTSQGGIQKASQTEKDKEVENQRIAYRYVL